MKTKLWSQLIFIVLIVASLLILSQTSNGALYFILVGFYMIFATLFLFIGKDDTLRIAVLITSGIIGVYIAGQFDAYFIRVVSAVAIAGLACYVTAVKIHTHRSNR